MLATGTSSEFTQHSHGDSLSTLVMLILPTFLKLWTFWTNYYVTTHKKDWQQGKQWNIDTLTTWNNTNILFLPLLENDSSQMVPLILTLLLLSTVCASCCLVLTLQGVHSWETMVLELPTVHPNRNISELTTGEETLFGQTHPSRHLDCINIAFFLFQLWKLLFACYQHPIWTSWTGPGEGTKKILSVFEHPREQLSLLMVISKRTWHLS